MRGMKVLLITTLCGSFILSGCERKTYSEDLGNIDVSEIESVDCSGTSGRQNGEFFYTLSEKEKGDFIDLLNQVELGDEVDKSQALSSGAVIYYTLHFSEGDSVEISPGSCFFVQDTYYVFENFDELWDEFVEFNSLG